MANTQALRKQLKTIPAEAFTGRWAGFATMKQEYRMKRSQEDLSTNTYNEVESE